MSSNRLKNGITSKQKRFSIDDAFEEETDEAIKVYGTTANGTGDCNGVKIENGRCDTKYNFFDFFWYIMLSCRCLKFSSDTARDSDSLIQDCYDGSSQDYINRSCFTHPKVRENWRMVLAATLLLFIGAGLIIVGALALVDPNAGLQGAVFLLTGFICFLPGAYHVVYIYLAAKGKRGYHFHNLPLFS